MIHVSRYRWVVLAVFALITVVIQIQWLTFAAIAREARLYYGVSPLAIDSLSLVFMGVFLVACFPASWIINTHGIRVGQVSGIVFILFYNLAGFRTALPLFLALAALGLSLKLRESGPILAAREQHRRVRASGKS